MCVCVCFTNIFTLYNISIITFIVQPNNLYLFDESD